MSWLLLAQEGVSTETLRREAEGLGSMAPAAIFALLAFVLAGVVVYLYRAGQAAQQGQVGLLRDQIAAMGELGKALDRSSDAQERVTAALVRVEAVMVRCEAMVPRRGGES